MIRKKEKTVSAEDDYTDSLDPATHDAPSEREVAPVDPIVTYLADMKAILLRDIKEVAMLDTADPALIVLALAGEKVYLDAHANLDQIRGLARFLGKHIRIAELEAELAELRAS